MTPAQEEAARASLPAHVEWVPWSACASFDHVTHRLLVGAALWTRERAERLARLGVTDLIDCRSEEQRTLESTPSLVGLDIRAMWTPTDDDGQRKGEDWFAPGIRAALEALAHPGRRVYVHCAAGINRGPSMALAILLAQGIDRTTAEDLIRRARPIAHIAYAADAARAVRALGYL